MKFLGIGIVFLSAISLSVLAAYISIIGMMALFPADGITIAIMMAFLEAAKLVAATWLHSNWYNKSVSFLHKTYLSIAVVVIMIITAMGIYGYLSKGYLDQLVPVGTTTLQISLREDQIQTHKDVLKRLTERQNQLDKAVNEFIDLKQVSRSQTLRVQQKPEREQIAKDLISEQKEIDRISQELLPLRISTTNVEAKLGPIKYVADLFGWSKPDSAVRMVILMIMFAFDPLAIVLVLSGFISIREEKPKKSLPIVHHNHVIQKIESQKTQEPIDDLSDKQTIIGILQRNPHVIEEILDTVIEHHGNNNNNTNNST